MDAKYILAVVSLTFLAAGGGKLVRKRELTPQCRTWLLVGVIFGGVSIWLFRR